uniref:Bm13477 n=1 Tax=Brugia malayi TaxID=6279 RepID=A0A1I9G2N8_BRUMA|nr:Bm13477 [Brugia malayi]
MSRRASLNTTYSGTRNVVSFFLFAKLAAFFDSILRMELLNHRRFEILECVVQVELNLLSQFSVYTVSFVLASKALNMEKNEKRG